jgi:hypothetical protein
MFPLHPKSYDEMLRALPGTKREEQAKQRSEHDADNMATPFFRQGSIQAGASWGQKTERNATGSSRKRDGCILSSCKAVPILLLTL